MPARNIFAVVLSSKKKATITSGFAIWLMFSHFFFGFNVLLVLEPQMGDRSTYPLHTIAHRPLFKYLGWLQLTDQGWLHYKFFIVLFYE